MDKQEKFSSDLKEADTWLLTPGQMQGCEALCLLGSLAGPRHHAGCWSMCHPFPSYSLVRHRETLSWVCDHGGDRACAWDVTAAPGLDPCMEQLQSEVVSAIILELEMKQGTTAAE